jgi:hypothetical protein
LKQLFKEEIEEERKILTESTEILVEKPIPVEPVIKPIPEPQKIPVPKRVPEEAKRKGLLASIDIRVRVGMMVILCIFGGLVFYLLLTRQPSTKVTPVSEKVARATPPTSPPAPRIKVDQPKEKPRMLEQKESISEEKLPPPAAKIEKEASVKAVEQKPLSPFAGLLGHGPQLLQENKQLRILEQINKLTGEERQNINIKILESFAHLKRYVLDKDKSSKQPWGQLYKSIENSKDRSATPMLLRITKDQEDYTRLYAVTLLGSIGDQRALNDLQQIANTDPNRKIRSGAAKAVAIIQKTR